VIGGGKAVLGHMAQNQAASRRNKNRALLYNAEKVKVEREHAINLGNYYLRGVDAEHTWAENAIEASLAVQEQQAVLNDSVARAFVATEGDYVKLASNARVAKSLERSGKSAGRVGRAGLAAYGRAIAGRHAVIDRQRDTAKNFFAKVQQQKEKSNREADLNIGFEPQRGAMPAKPVWDKGPGLLSLVVNTALGAYGGYKMGQQLQGLKPGGGTGDTGGTGGTGGTGTYGDYGSSIDISYVAPKRNLLQIATNTGKEFNPWKNLPLLPETTTPTTMFPDLAGTFNMDPSKDAFWLDNYNWGAKS
tara:strand:+ start:2849 stop:3760 length:912 start_codon:yes stop_codon:yes gene_type:complete